VTTVSTHVLDTARGRPAEGVAVTFDVLDDGVWQGIGRAVSGPDGRVTDLPRIGAAGPVSARLVFTVREYLVRTHGAAFFSEITVAFEAGPGEHYHMPLLLSPFGYSTYRGS
jgi:5-hydroxyisourate hydrolase